MMEASIKPVQKDLNGINQYSILYKPVTKVQEAKTTPFTVPTFVKIFKADLPIELNKINRFYFIGLLVVVNLEKYYP